MLNFAEQTGSGAVIFVWSFLTTRMNLTYIKCNLRCADCAHNQKERKVVVGALKSDFNLILRDGRCTVKPCAFVPLCLCAFVPLLHSTRPKQISAHPCSNMPDARHGPCCLLPPPKQTTDAPMVWMSARVVHRRSRKNNIEEMHKLGALLKDSDESACFCTPGSSKSSCLWRHSFCFFGK